MLSDLQVVYMVPRNSTQLSNINTTKFQVERKPVYLSSKKSEFESTKNRLKDIKLTQLLGDQMVGCFNFNLKLYYCIGVGCICMCSKFYSLPKKNNNAKTKCCFMKGISVRLCFFLELE